MVNQQPEKEPEKLVEAARKARKWEVGMLEEQKEKPGKSWRESLRNWRKLEEEPGEEPGN